MLQDQKVLSILVQLQIEKSSWSNFHAGLETGIKFKIKVKVQD